MKISTFHLEFVFLGKHLINGWGALVVPGAVVGNDCHKSSNVLLCMTLCQIITLCPFKDPLDQVMCSFSKSIIVVQQFLQLLFVDCNKLYLHPTIKSHLTLNPIRYYFWCCEQPLKRLFHPSIHPDRDSGNGFDPFPFPLAASTIFPGMVVMPLPDWSWSWRA